MHEQPHKVPLSAQTGLQHLHALMLLDEIEEGLLNLSADFREFRVRITQLGLLDTEAADIAQ